MIFKKQRRPPCGGSYVRCAKLRRFLGSHLTITGHSSIQESIWEDQQMPMSAISPIPLVETWNFPPYHWLKLETLSLRLVWSYIKAIKSNFEAEPCRNVAFFHETPKIPKIPIFEAMGHHPCWSFKGRISSLKKQQPNNIGSQRRGVVQTSWGPPRFSDVLLILVGLCKAIQHLLVLKVNLTGFLWEGLV